MLSPCSPCLLSALWTVRPRERSSWAVRVGQLPGHSWNQKRCQGPLGKLRWGEGGFQAEVTGWSLGVRLCQPAPCLHLQQPGILCCVQRVPALPVLLCVWFLPLGNHTGSTCPPSPMTFLSQSPERSSPSETDLLAWLSPPFALSFSSQG